MHKQRKYALDNGFENSYTQKDNWESSLAPSKLQGQEFSIVTITEGRGGRKTERVIKKRNNEKKRKDKTTYE